MTQKHFIALAATLAAAFSTGTVEVKLAIWSLTLSQADVCAQANDNFNRDRFYAAVFGTSDHFAIRDALKAERNAVSVKVWEV
jgi:hypothetical protein